MVSVQYSPVFNFRSSHFRNVLSTIHRTQYQRHSAFKRRIDSLFNSRSDKSFVDHRNDTLPLPHCSLYIFLRRVWNNNVCIFLQSPHENSAQERYGWTSREKMAGVTVCASAQWRVCDGDSLWTVCGVVYTWHTVREFMTRFKNVRRKRPLDSSDIKFGKKSRVFNADFCICIFQTMKSKLSDRTLRESKVFSFFFLFLFFEELLVTLCIQWYEQWASARRLSRSTHSSMFVAANTRSGFWHVCDAADMENCCEVGFSFNKTRHRSDRERVRMTGWIRWM